MRTVGRDNIKEIIVTLDEIKRLAKVAQKTGNPFAPALIIQIDFLESNLKKIEAA